MKSSRRSFLQNVGIATTLAVTQPGAIFAEQESAPAAEKPLPAPIARLKSRKSEAQPITMEERLGRIQRAQQLMRDNKLDAIMMIGGTSLNYFTGIRW